MHWQISCLKYLHKLLFNEQQKFKVFPQVVASQNRIVEKIPLKNKLLMKAVIQENAQLMVTRFNNQDTMAACGYSDGFVRVFNLGTDNKIAEMNTSPKESGPVNALRWRPTNQMNSTTSAVLLVGNTNGHLYQYAAKTGKQIWTTYEEGNYIMAVDYTSDGHSFCTAGKDNLIRIYDEQTKKITNNLTAVKWHKPGHNNRLFAVKFKKDQPDILISGGWDQNVNVWDVRTGSVVNSFYGIKVAGDSIDIRDNFVLTGANRGKDQLQLWDWRQNKLVHTFRWDQYEETTNGFVYCAQFCGYNRNTVMAVGGSDAKFYNVEDYNQIVQLNFDKENLLYTCDSGNTGTRFLAGGKNGALFYFGNNKTLE